MERLFAEGLVEPARLRELFTAIEPRLYRYPAIAPREFREAVETAIRHAESL